MLIELYIFENMSGMDRFQGIFLQSKQWKHIEHVNSYCNIYSATHSKHQPDIGAMLGHIDDNQEERQ